jgi:UPF0755 protein
MTRSSRTTLVESGEGCGSTLLGCILVSGSLTFVVVIMLAMIPAVRGLVRDAIASLAGGRIRTVTIPEGWNRFQVASRLANQGVVPTPEAFLDATTDASVLEYLDIPAGSVEGYLFPDTYDFYTVSEPDEVVEKMVSNHRNRFRKLAREHPGGLERLGKLGEDPAHVAVILASIVEKEAARASEQPRIAGVFLNRLLGADFPSRLLQADPTVAYGCIALDPPTGPCSGFDGRLLRRQLDDPDNPYNTYVHSGLPPGPISNPGLGALEAALDPEETSYLYFVARGDGTHEFSATLEEHKQAVKAYRDGD